MRHEDEQKAHAADVLLEEFETLVQARSVIGAFIDTYHHRPHSGLNHRTPAEFAQTWQHPDDHLDPAA